MSNDLEVKIKKNVPAPVVRTPYAAWPFHKMEVGDSFLVPPGRETNARNALRNFKDRHKTWEFATKHVTKHGERTIRIWRVK